MHIRTHFGVIHSLTKNNQTLPIAEQISKEQEEDLSVKPWDFYGRAVQQSNKITVSVPLNGGEDINPFFPDVPFCFNTFQYSAVKFLTP